LEIDLLALVRNKDKYYRFKPYIKDHVLTKEALLIYNSIDTFFKQFKDQTDIDWNAFEAFFFVLRNSQISPAQRTSYRNIFDKLKAHTPALATDILLKHFVTADYATQIADTALKVREGSAAIDDVAKLVEKHDSELRIATTPTKFFVTGDLSDMLSRASTPGLEWRLEELNISLGPARQGDFILIAAYVGTGKTTLTASEVSHMASQLKDDRPVVWVNNEEESNKVLLRIMQSALGITVADINKDVAAATAAYNKLMGMPNRILVTPNDTSVCNVDYLSDMFEKVKPAIIVFDQLDKVAGFEREAEKKEYERLGRLYKWARELSHKYGPTIAITQCDGSADSSQYIKMNQLRGSKVDKPAEADAIITVGKVDNPAYKHKRYIHVPKNKMFGGARSDEAHREGYWEVDIRPEIARYEGTK
jgi:KaiC/GvpD/RAD55 family RecA-like ATPase